MSSIDLTFCSANVSLIADWSTKKETLGSTHCIIEISLNICLSSKSLVTHSVPKNIEKSFLNKKLSEIFLSNDFNDCDNLNKLELFSKRFNDSFKVKTSKKVKLPNPWWNAECNLASASLRRAVARFELCPSRENYSHLCNLRKKYKYIIRKEKSKGWKNFCASIDCQITVSELWKTIRCFKGNYNNSMTAFNECLLEFCDQLAGPAGPFYYISPGQTQDDHFVLENTSYSELDKAIIYTKIQHQVLMAYAMRILKTSVLLTNLNYFVCLMKFLGPETFHMTGSNTKLCPLRRKMVTQTLHRHTDL